MNDNKPEFWHTVKELEPPRNKNVWTTSNPFVSAPVIRLNSWDGTEWNWNHHHPIYWAEPISRKRSKS